MRNSLWLSLLGSITNPWAAMAWQRAKAKAKASALGPSQPEAVEGPAGSAATAPDLPELPPIADVEGLVGLSVAAAPQPRAQPNAQHGPRSGVAAQIAHLQATTKICIPRARFTHLCCEILQQMAPDVVSI